jgi:predicted regulator of Ras-like GTPase activity (Roadblock/LC7/MglB family)
MAKNILIMDRDRPVLVKAVESLSSSAQTDHFNVFATEDTERAKELLGSFPFDLVLYSRERPPSNGLELMAFMREHQPHTPFVAVKDFEKLGSSNGGPKTEAQSQSGRGIPGRRATERILDELNIHPQDCLFGLTLPSYLQLVEPERRTCLIEISLGTSRGQLIFCYGELVKATCGDIEGDDAVYEMLGWESPALVINDYNVTDELDGNVFLSVDHSIRLWETFSLREKGNIDKERGDVAGAGSVESVKDIEVVLSEITVVSENTLTLHKEGSMGIEKFFEPLKEIRGYKAVGIMNYTGEVVAYDSVDPAIDLALVGATFNDIFRSAHEASKKIGLDACREAVILTPKGIIVMTCSGVNAKVHFHTIAILSADGNQALMKMQLEKMMPAVMAEL